MSAPVAVVAIEANMIWHSKPAFIAVAVATFPRHLPYRQTARRIPAPNSCRF